MKNSLQLLLVSILIALILVACGQGEGPIDPEESGSGIDSDHNEELIEENDEQVKEETEPVIEDETNEETAIEDNIHVVELYFADSQVMNLYKVETTIEAEVDELFLKTMELTIAGPAHEELFSLIPSDVKVQYVKEEDGIAHVSFSEELLNVTVGSGGEGMLVQQIALVMKQFGFDRTQILIDGEKHNTLAGHVDTSEPIEAMDPSTIEKLN
ncbi:GerMN domain-containing protein [Alkalihalobacterium elongatum]|uniref:GerMN domain-containing protein n=1 Tax=Alkalihalobacterium elongatum TaxID=2675466 RepID=UPI001C1FD961|nr:GerMN domain-containing protein [Alkalihalobacterium elongatum]